MPSRRIDLTTELTLEDLNRIENRVFDAFLATREAGFLIPPSRITLTGSAGKARKEAERLRYKYVIIAYKPERRSEAIKIMKCPFVDVISFDLDTSWMIDREMVHIARVNGKAIELVIDDVSEIYRLIKSRHRLTVKYVPIYFGSGAKSRYEWVDMYSLNGALRRVLKYDLLGSSARNQRNLLIRNRNRLEGYELSRGVRHVKNIQSNKVGKNGGREAD